MNAFLKILISGFLLLAGPGTVANAAGTGTVSGQIVDGIRILTVPDVGTDLDLTVYRGDYIKFKRAKTADTVTLSIPALAIHQVLSKNPAKAPYFKMKQTGNFAFTLGNVSGTIAVISYSQSKYREVSAAEAAKVIAARGPLILDVRTPGEYKRGRLENAALLPVQVLQQNLEKLAAYKDREILVYCATGNRSTVASKILIDNGFNRILNLRYGIVDWHKRSYPVVK